MCAILLSRWFTYELGDKFFYANGRPTASWGQICVPSYGTIFSTKKKRALLVYYRVIIRMKL
jgi:hypothetical protein